MSGPDLSAERTYAEAVAYGKLLAVRELLDELRAARPTRCSTDEEFRGYSLAVQVVKRHQLDHARDLVARFTVRSLGAEETDRG